MIGGIVLSSKYPVNKNDILAIIQANRQLGPDYDEQAADQIYELLQKSYQPSSEMTPEDIIRILGQFPSSERKRLLRPFVKRKHSVVGTISAVMALSIPFIALAGASAHIDGILAVLGFDAFVILLGVAR